MNFTHTPLIHEMQQFPLRKIHFRCFVFTNKGQWMALLELHRKTAILLHSLLHPFSFSLSLHFSRLLLRSYSLSLMFSSNRIVFILIKLLYFHFSDFRVCSDNPSRDLADKPQTHIRTKSPDMSREFNTVMGTWCIQCTLFMNMK